MSEHNQIPGLRPTSEDPVMGTQALERLSAVSSSDPDGVSMPQPVFTPAEVDSFLDFAWEAEMSQWINLDGEVQQPQSPAPAPVPAPAPTPTPAPAPAPAQAQAQPQPQDLALARPPAPAQAHQLPQVSPQGNGSGTMVNVAVYDEFTRAFGQLGQGHTFRGMRDVISEDPVNRPGYLIPGHLNHHHRQFLNSMGFAVDQIVELRAQDVSWQFCHPEYLHRRAVNNFMESGMNIYYEDAEPIARKGSNIDVA